MSGIISRRILSMDVVVAETAWGHQGLGDVFRTLFDLETQPTDDRASDAASIQAYVALAGGVQRLGVVFCCSPTLADKLAASMFGCPESDVTEAERFDAIGETANVLAGRVKADLAPDARIGLPAICLQERGSVHVSGGQACSEINILVGGQTASVTVYVEAGE